MVVVVRRKSPFLLRRCLPLLHLLLITQRTHALCTTKVQTIKGGFSTNNKQT